MEFFQNPKIVEILKTIGSNIAKNKNKTLAQELILISTNLITNRQEIFDESCEFFITQFGEEIKTCLTKYTLYQIEEGAERYPREEVEILSHLYLILTEEAITNNNTRHPKLIADLLNTLEKLNEEKAAETKLIEKTMIYQKTAKYLPTVLEKNLKTVTIDAGKQKKELEEYLEKTIEKIDNLRNQANGLLNEYNFIVLAKGFTTIRKEKTREKYFTLTLLAILIGAIIGLPIWKLLEIQKPEKINTDILIYTTPILLGIEAFLVYLFRIALHNHKAVKAQLLQIALRLSLCQFVLDYSKQSKEIKTDNPAALEKFESLIFSGIVSNEEAIPSIYDGLEALTKIISAAKGKQ